MAIDFQLSALLAVSNNLNLIANRLPLVQSRGIATLQRRIPVIARRDIQAQYNLSAARIRKGLTTRLTRGGVELIASSREIGLRQFATRVGDLFRVQVDRKRAPVVFRHAFEQVPAMAVIAATGPQLYERVKEGGRRVGRTPIKRMRGPTMAAILRGSGRAERLRDAAAEVLRLEFARLVKI